MIICHARCVGSPDDRFQATTIERRNPGPHDVLIHIVFAGICHSDVEHARSLRGKSVYPLVPGHEIAGIVTSVGSLVSRFAVGDHVGVGNIIDSCRQCVSCEAGHEQYCPTRVLTYNSLGRDGRRTQGGYSEQIVVDERVVVKIPDALPLENAAPLFCAGITLYSPLRRWKVGPGKRVGIVGFGGLGHVGVQIAKAMGARVIAIDLSQAKRADALRLGADDYRLGDDPALFKDFVGALDLVISTVPVDLDLDAYLRLLAVDGLFVNLSVPNKPLSVTPALLLENRRSIAGSRSGGLPETQEMIDFCAAHNIRAEVEVIDADHIDAAFERLIVGDVRYRFVIDARTLR
jgi:uncharacterized zinc-type alcohol dehydrogenase-like protein